MAVRLVGWGMGTFFSGAVAKYVWIKPELNSSGLKTLAKWGLWGLGIQTVANLIAMTVFNSHDLGTEKKRQRAQKLALAGLFITVIASIPASVYIGRRWGIQVEDKEARVLVLVSTITNVVIGKALAP